MKTIIRCCTLFDITNTGITSRKIPLNIVPEKITSYENDRKRQSNFDTVLQIIGLRTQPEDISNVDKTTVDFKKNNNFGFLFDEEEPQNMWSFLFTINYKGVYNDGIDELGGLYDDCHGVPIFKVGTEFDKLPNFLDATPELKNIYFEVISDE